MHIRAAKGQIKKSWLMLLTALGWQVIYLYITFESQGMAKTKLIKSISPVQ